MGKSPCINTQDTSTSTNMAPASTQKSTQKTVARRPGQTLACGWCGSPILLPAPGRVPKWCSSSGRHRAWELTRAAASGRAAVHVVDRAVEVDKLIPVIDQAPASPHGTAWSYALADLVAELDTGRVYDRDLPALADALGKVLSALDRRPGWRRHPHR